MEKHTTNQSTPKHMTLLNEKPKLRDLFEHDWYRKLEPFLKSPMFKDIGKVLTACDREITPRFEDTFRAFKECPWSKLSVVIMGLDPFPGKLPDGRYIADGLAFSARDSIGCPKSLDTILDAIDQEIYNGEGYHLTQTFDLGRWARQGVLLLNSALSYPLGTPSGTHTALWHPFIRFVLQTINDDKDGVSVLALGARATDLCSHVFNNKNFQILHREHPSYANRQLRRWKSDDCFKQIDAFQVFMNKNKIKW
jgi:uracil-DNA glycosylase